MHGPYPDDDGAHDQEAADRLQPRRVVGPAEHHAQDAEEEQRDDADSCEKSPHGAIIDRATGRRP